MYIDACVIARCIAALIAGGEDVEALANLVRQTNTVEMMGVIERRAHEAVGQGIRDIRRP